MKPFFYSRISIKKYYFRTFVIFSLFLIIHSSNLYSRNIRSLKNQKIESLEIIYDKSQLRNAGNNFPFGIEVKLKNNKTVKTKGYLSGTVRWRNFEIEVLGGKYFLGNIYIPGKNDLVKPDFVIVVIRSKYHDNIYTRKRIELNYLTKIELFSTKNFNKAPGNRIYPGIVKTFNNNQKEVISQQRLVDKEMDNFEVICEGGNFSSGRFIISNNIFNITNHHVSFSIYHKENAELNASFSATLDYIDDFRYFARGSSGSDGNPGADGSDGSDGGTGSNGQNGTDGSNGNHGSDGDDGPHLEIYADAYFDSILQTDLVKVVIYNLDNNKESYYYVNPKGGSIKIYTIGGEGGDGGNGGDGGDAGDGGNGKSTKRTITKTVPCGNGETCEETETIVEVGKGGNGGNGGNGGSGGDGGNGGYGGDIYAYFSYSVAPYEHIIELESLPGDEGDAGNYGDGGKGGDGGTPSGSDGSSGSDGRKGNFGDEGCHGEIFIYDWDGWLEF